MKVDKILIVTGGGGCGFGRVVSCFVVVFHRLSTLESVSTTKQRGRRLTRFELGENRLTDSSRVRKPPVYNNIMAVKQ